MGSKHQVRRLDAVYAAIPSANCQGRCQEGCGIIACSALEGRRMQTAAGGRPLTVDDALTCGYLTSAGRCAVYAVRPVICRLWGVVRKLTCPFGCEPDRWLSEVEAATLCQRVERISPILVHADITGLALDKAR